MIKNQRSSDQGEPRYERMSDSLGEAFVIFRATVAICAIFIGFVFAALLRILTIPEDLSQPERIAVWFLTAALILLLAGLLGYHRVANQVVRFWRIFFPESLTRFWATVGFVLGLFAMLAAVAALLWGKGLLVLALVVLGAATLLFPWTLSLGMIHRSNQGNVVWVGSQRPPGWLRSLCPIRHWAEPPEIPR